MIDNELMHTIKELTKAKDATLTGKHGRKQAKEFAEVTTPIWCIEKQLDLLTDDAFEVSKRVLDPCTGDGRYLMCYLVRKMEHSDDILTAVSTLHGLDIQQDNVDLARYNMMALARHICRAKGIEFDFWRLVKVVNENIKQGDFINVHRAED